MLTALSEKLPRLVEQLTFNQRAPGIESLDAYCRSHPLGMAFFLRQILHERNEFLSHKLMAVDERM